MQLNWDWLRIFYQVAKDEQISKAANSLFITQPAVSQSIKLLEEYIGISLFIRTPKGVKLTSCGYDLYKEIQIANKSINNFCRKIEEFQDDNIGELKFGASDTLCKHYLINPLKKFKKLRPNVKIHIYNMTTMEIIDSLKTGIIDIGFINLPNKLDETIEVTEIKKLQDCFICGEKYKNLISSPIQLSELVNYPILLLEKGTNMRKFVDDIFSKYGIKCLPEMELGSIDILTKLTLADFGISFVTKDFISEELNREELFEINVIEQIPSRSIGIIKLKDVIFPKCAKQFYNSFIE